MRYIRKINDCVAEYCGPAMGDTWYAANGYIGYSGDLPLSRLDVVDGAVVELPDPGPTPEQIAYETHNALMQRVVAQAIPDDDDATALALSPICPEWRDGVHYEAGEIVNRNGQPYRVVQTVDAIESQPPGAEGMLAVYRPLNPEHAGTLDDPIPFVNGMDVYTDKYYSFNGKTYLAKADMLPCTWEPGTAGLWQWEEVTDNAG